MSTQLVAGRPGRRWLTQYADYNSCGFKSEARHSTYVETRAGGREICVIPIARVSRAPCGRLVHKGAS